MPASSGELFISLSRASRKIWNIQRRFLFNVPIFIQTGKIDKETADTWTEELKKLSSSIFADGLVFTMGPTISIIGPQGAGKSTVVNELLNLDDVAKLPSNTEEGERLPILIAHRSKSSLFVEKGNPDALYINLDRRSEVKPEVRTYDEARKIALEEQESAGLIIWFADDKFLTRYNIFLPPGIKSSRVWLNEVMKRMIESVSLNLIVLDSRKLENVDYGRILESYYKSSTPYYTVLTFTDDVDDRENLLKMAAQILNLESDRIFLYPGKGNMEELRKILVKMKGVEKIDAIHINDYMIKAQVVRGEIEGVLREIMKEDIDEPLIGPVSRKFDEARDRILKEFRGRIRMVFSEGIFLKMFKKLNDIIKSHTIKFLGRKKLITDSLSAEIIFAFDEILKYDFKDELYKSLESYVDEYLDSRLSSLDKELLRLEWPIYVMYVHLIKEPHSRLEKLALKHETVLINLMEIFSKIEEIKSRDTELAKLLDNSNFEYTSPVERAIKKNIVLFFNRFQTELSNIVDMFVFEDIKASIAREKLNSLLFDATEEFQERVTETLERELDILKDKFLHKYQKIMGLKSSMANPMLFQEALSKAQIELERAIDMMVSIL